MTRPPGRGVSGHAACARGSSNETWKRNKPAKREGPRNATQFAGCRCDPAKVRARAEHGGHTYFFCCEGCAQKFRAAPEKYLAPPPKPAGPSLVVLTPGPAAKLPPPLRRASSSAGSVCDQSRRFRGIHLPDGSANRPARPGACPICGMALEPKTISAEEAPNEELISMTRRFWFSLALTLPCCFWRWAKCWASFAGSRRAQSS